MPAIDWRKLTPEQAKAWNSGLMRDAEHVGLGKDIAMALCIPIGIDLAQPGGDRSVVTNVFNPTGKGHDRIRDRMKDNTDLDLMNVARFRASHYESLKRAIRGPQPESPDEPMLDPITVGLLLSNRMGLQLSLKHRLRATPRQGVPLLAPQDAADLVAACIRRVLEERYPDAVNARCYGGPDEKPGQCVLGIHWQRGREVFYRRIWFDAAAVSQLGARRVADGYFVAIVDAINATEGAERK